MALTINTNISSIIAQRSLNNSTTSLNSSIERMTTGYKINHAKDNAAGLSIANLWVTQLSSLDVAADNASMGADMLTTAEETYSLLSSHLQRIRDLTEQAANGTYGTQSLRAIQSEIYARFQEISRISANSEFNQIKLADGTAGTIDLQIGLYSNSNSQITLDESLFGDASVFGLFEDLWDADAPGDNKKKLSELVEAADSSITSADKLKAEDGLRALSCACSKLLFEDDSFKIQDLTTNEDCLPKEMLAYLDAAIDDISGRVTKIGAAQNRVSSALTALDVQSQNITSSLSTLRDTDVAESSSNYLKQQILQQASATLLSTANQLPSMALNLI